VAVSVQAESVTPVDVSLAGAVLSPRRSWLVAGLACVAIAALAGGLTAWLRSPKAVEGSTITPSQSQEKFLLEAVERYRDAKPDDTEAVEIGIRHCVELGLFYLSQHRLDDADRFFEDLMQHPNGVKAYKTLGRIGHAIVLAFQDKPEESNKIFLEILNRLPSQGSTPDRVFFMLDQRHLRREIGRALDFNKANAPAGQIWDKRLDRLREPPKWKKK
jgi:hypothetical protein